ncbi:MAG: hypothetical protein LUH02_08045 [Erysipelotrichaceae bacterium]|nr:hypothetical protein [Erysipelotrichaceae bacterium]
MNYLIFKKALNKYLQEVYDFYLTVLYHSVYLRNRVAYQNNYVEAMKLAHLEIENIDFVEHLSHFISIILK